MSSVQQADKGGVSRAEGGVLSFRPRPSALRPRGGFTLIEALAAVALLGIGIVGTTASFGALIRNEDRARQTETMQRLAEEKLAELTATGQATTSADGDFTDQNEPDYTWSLESSSSGITDLDAVKLTVTHTGGGETARLDTLVYVVPDTATTGGTGG